MKDEYIDIRYFQRNRHQTKNSNAKYTTSENVKCPF